jgi:hypothetical protein
MAGIIVKINGVEYANLADSYKIKEQAGAIGTAGIDVEIQPEEAVPKVQDLLQLYHDGDCFFLGLISEVDTPEYSSGAEPERYKIEAQSFETILKYRLINDAWESESADIRTSDIVADIYNNYLAEEGITIGNIAQTNRMWQTYKAQYMTAYAVLKELADEIGYTFYISTDRKFYFVSVEELVTVQTPVHIKKVSGKYVSDDMRSVQYITGGSEDTSAQTESSYWQTNQTTITLGYALSNLIGITINGSTVGIGVRGIDESDTGVTFLYKQDTNTITLNSAATVKPLEGDLVVIVYYGVYGITVVDNNATLEEDISLRNGTSGKIENLYNDDTLENYSDGEALALGLLDQYGTAQTTVSCTCHDFIASKLLNIWEINEGRELSGNFVITERTITSFGPEQFKIVVKLKNKNFYARYGLVITSTEKKKREDTVIYKTPLVSELLHCADAVEAQGEVSLPETGNIADDVTAEGQAEENENITMSDILTIEGQIDIIEPVNINDAVIIDAINAYFPTLGDYTDGPLYDGFYPV